MTRERVKAFKNTPYGEEGRAILHSSLSEECVVTAGGRKNHSFVFSYGKTPEKTNLVRVAAGTRGMPPQCSPSGPAGALPVFVFAFCREKHRKNQRMKQNVVISVRRRDARDTSWRP